MKKLLENPKLDATLAAEYRLVKGRAGDYTKDELTHALKKYNVKAPETNADISEPFVFNLMFETSIGPTGQFRGFLRPETAQGMQLILLLKARELNLPSRYFCQLQAFVGVQWWQAPIRCCSDW